MKSRGLAKIAEAVGKKKESLRTLLSGPISMETLKSKAAEKGNKGI